MPISDRNTIIVAGHLCLDIIPGLGDLAGPLDSLLAPGKLVNVDSAIIATGGAVSNTGQALHRLGADVRLMGKVGDDPLGTIVVALLARSGAALADGMIVSATDQTSYTIVISPPGVDRIFLHFSGANRTFCAADIDYDMVSNAALFHFGYPPLMEATFAGGGGELTAMFRRAKDAGAVTSLDMALPDAASEAGRADWPAILAATLPHVDIFAPSLDEILFMLDPDGLARLRDGDQACLGDLARSVSAQLLDMGAALVLLKLGDAGIYLRTTDNPQRLTTTVGRFGSAAREWADIEMYAPCFKVDVAGTTGAGDCTIAGFLAAVVKGMTPGEAMTAAVAVGACNVEAPDATSGIRNWEQTWDRIHAGWDRLPAHAAFAGLAGPHRQG